MDWKMKKSKNETLTKLHRYLRFIGREDLVNKGWKVILPYLEERLGLELKPGRSNKNRALRIKNTLKRKYGDVPGKSKTNRYNNVDPIKEFYNSYAWRKLRYQVILKYGRKCMACGDTDKVIHVDHIKPLRKYWDLRLDEDNLQVLCEECNHGKGNSDETDWRP